MSESPLLRVRHLAKSYGALAGCEDIGFDLWPGVTHACIHTTRMLDAAQRHIETMAGWVRERLAA